MSQCVADPEVLYFLSLPGAPASADLPKTVGNLARRKGLRKAHALRDARYNDTYWDRWLAAVPGARAWFDSDAALYPPESWPAPLAEVLPDHVTPAVWIDNVCAWDQGVRGFRKWCPPGTGAISAYALGWPLPEQDVERAALAATELWRHSQFVIWMYDLHLDGIPLPMYSQASLKDKLKARDFLQRRPLSTGRVLLRRALPPMAQDPVFLLATCPRRSKGVSRSQKLSLTRAWARLGRG